MTEPRTLTEAVNLGKTKTEIAHIMGQVAGINKAIRAFNMLLMSANSLDEVRRIQAAIKDLMAESHLLLKEAEQLTKPLTEEEKRKLTES